MTTPVTLQQSVENILAHSSQYRETTLSLRGRERSQPSIKFTGGRRCFCKPKISVFCNLVIFRERVVDSSCNRGHVTLNEPGRSSDSEAAPTAD